jgi:hypothetical protein
LKGKKQQRTELEVYSANGARPPRLLLYRYLSHFEESHSGEKGVTACLMLRPNPFQLQLIGYFLQSTLQVLAAFHKIL